MKKYATLHIRQRENKHLSIYPLKKKRGGAISQKLELYYLDGIGTNKIERSEEKEKG